MKASEYFLSSSPISEYSTTPGTFPYKTILPVFSPGKLSTYLETISRGFYPSIPLIIPINKGSQGLVRILSTPMK
jgi:hypothetical protein